MATLGVGLLHHGLKPSGSLLSIWFMYWSMFARFKRMKSRSDCLECFQLLYSDSSLFTHCSRSVSFIAVFSLVSCLCCSYVAVLVIACAA